MDQWQSTWARGRPLIRTARVYQRARKGTKTIAVDLRTGAVYDVWMNANGAAVGEVIELHHPVNLVWGPHNQNPVLRIDPYIIASVTPPHAVSAINRAYLRHQQSRVAA